jgi:predicted PurR-regulated permease PerM
MQDIFMQSQWDTLLAYLKQGRPPLWILLCAVNGGFLLFWLYAWLVKRRPLRPATVGLMRVLFVVLNAAVIFRDDTLRIIRPFLRYFV